MNNWDEVMNAIDECVQQELGYKTDLITNKGWEEIETKAPTRSLNALKEDFESPGDIEEMDVQSMFDKELNNTEIKLRDNDSWS